MYFEDYSMIIDDEGDDISQNTTKEKFEFDDLDAKYVENERSTNNSKIINDFSSQLWHNDILYVWRILS